MTFLEIVRAAALESGTLSSFPQTVTGLSGRQAMFVGWVREAYRLVQTSRDWRWLRADFSGALLPGVQTYAPSSLGISDRFGAWVQENDGQNFTVYAATEGIAHEGWLRDLRWEEMRTYRMIGSARTEIGKPAEIAVTPDDRLAVWPIPDAEHTLRGEYRKAPQVLTESDDVPEMPASYHQAIKWRAMMLMAVFDETFDLKRIYEMEYDQVMGPMVRSHMPKMILPGAMA